MTDLTKIDKPFGLLDDETKVALRNHPGHVEWFDGNRWVTVGPSLSWNPYYTYRAKAQPKVIWVNESAHSMYAYRTEDQAKTSATLITTHVAVKYIEVPE